MAEKFVAEARAEMKAKGTEGAFRKQTGAKEGEPIPEKKIQKALGSDNETTRKRAQFAENMKSIARKRALKRMA